MSDPFLLIDIGNSATKLGVTRRGTGGRAVSRVVRVPTHPATVRDAGLALDRLRADRSLAGAVGASVVPGARASWSRAVQRATGLPVQWVRHDWVWNFRWRYAHPETMGADRLVTLCAARRRYAPPLIVLDLGTALTLDLLTAENEYIGGMIAPGVAMLTGAMAARTACLPELTIRIGRLPRRAWGRNTREAMRCGTLFGFRGMLRELLASAMECLGFDVTICATGGYAAKAMAMLPDIACRIHPKLALEGLAWAARLNRERFNRLTLNR